MGLPGDGLLPRAELDSSEVLNLERQHEAANYHHE